MNIDTCKRIKDLYAYGNLQPSAHPWAEAAHSTTSAGGWAANPGDACPPHPTKRALRGCVLHCTSWSHPTRKARPAGHRICGRGRAFGILSGVGGAEPTAGAALGRRQVRRCQKGRRRKPQSLHKPQPGRWPLKRPPLRSKLRLVSGGPSKLFLQQKLYHASASSLVHPTLLA